MSIYNFSEKAITCSEDIFSTDTYNNATLYVPRGRIAAYSRTTPWNSFYIEEMKEFNITYIVDGEEYMVVKVEYGATIEPLEEPTKEGHTFSGWSEIPETMPAEDVTITGSFTANNYIVTFMIDGEVYDTATVEYGTKIELPTPPEKEGYIFSGWVEVPETMPAEDIVIEGSYEVDTTGINAIELDLERNEVYNLNGLRITETENLSRGFYIINGKKVYVK